MKGLILCAGKGTRLYPFTRTYPKTLIPIANIPILQTCISKLVEQNIHEIGIVIHPSQTQLIKKQVGNGEQWGIQLTYIYQNEPRGIAAAVKDAQSFIGDDSFILLLGDNIIAESLNMLTESIKRDEIQASLLLAEVQKPQDYGVAEVIDQRIIRLVEKPKKPKSNLAVLGAYAFNSTIFDAIYAISPSKRGEYEITDAIQWLIDQGFTVSYHITEQHNIDVGTPDRWLKANRWMLERTVDYPHIHQTAIIVNCQIIQPVSIAEGVELHNCMIGPYVSIGAYSNIHNCKIQNSIVMNQVHLKNIPHTLTNTIIGYQSVITGN